MAGVTKVEQRWLAGGVSEPGCFVKLPPAQHSGEGEGEGWCTMGAGPGPGGGIPASLEQMFGPTAVERLSDLPKLSLQIPLQLSPGQTALWGGERAPRWQPKKASSDPRGVPNLLPWHNIKSSAGMGPAWRRPLDGGRDARQSSGRVRACVRFIAPRL